MVDMSALLNLDTSDAKPPAELSDGVYPVTVVNWKTGTSRFDANKGLVAFECRPDGFPEGVEASFDITKRRIFKEFELDPTNVNSYYYLNMWMDAIGVKRAGKRPNEYVPEAIGQNAWLSVTKRAYMKKDGTPGEATDVKMVIDGRVITERRAD